MPAFPKTIWLYREQPTKADALKHAFDQFDTMLRKRGREGHLVVTAR